MVKNAFFTTLWDQHHCSFRILATTALPHGDPITRHENPTRPMVVCLLLTLK